MRLSSLFLLVWKVAELFYRLWLSSYADQSWLLKVIFLADLLLIKFVLIALTEVVWSGFDTKLRCWLLGCIRRTLSPIALATSLTRFFNDFLKLIWSIDDSFLKDSIAVLVADSVRPVAWDGSRYCLVTISSLILLRPGRHEELKRPHGSVC